MRINVRLSLLTIGGLFAASLATSIEGHAQQRQAGSGPKEDTLQEVAVTGQYAPSSTARAVQRIKIIDRKKMDALAVQNLRDVLFHEMNIQLAQDNILGSSLSVQGVSGQNVKILIDGVPVIGRQDGNVDISQINLHNIERIEIVEGPMSVNYGTDALAGTINLITKKTLQNNWEGGISTYYQTIGTYNINGRLGLHKGNHTVIATGGRNLFDGWSDGDGVSLDFSKKPANRNRVQQWKPKEQYTGGLQYTYKIGKTTLNYKGDFFNEMILNRGEPDYYGEKASDDYYRTRRIDNAIFVNNALAKDKNLNIQLAYNDYRRVKNTYVNDLTTLKKTLSEGSGAQDTSHFNLINSRGVYSTSRSDVKLNYEIGYDINVESATGVRIKDKTRQIGDYAAFISAEYKPFKELTIRPGLRYAYNTGYTAPLVPSVNVRYNINSFILRGSYAKGFRAPTLKELYFNFNDINHDINGNENLTAENSDNLNFSAAWSKAYRSFILKLEGSVFYNDIRNRIDLALIEGTAYTYVNIGRYKTQGIQVSTDVIIKDLKISVGGGYVGRYNALSEDIDLPQFNYTPEMRGSVTYEMRKTGVTAALFCKYTGRAPGYVLADSGKLQNSFISPYRIADFSLSKFFIDKKVNLSIGCKNLFDVKTINRSAAGDGSVSGSAHSTGGTSLPYSTGRSYFVKADINLNGK